MFRNSRGGLFWRLPLWRVSETTLRLDLKRSAQVSDIVKLKYCVPTPWSARQQRFQLTDTRGSQSWHPLLCLSQTWMMLRWARMPDKVQLVQIYLKSFSNVFKRKLFWLKWYWFFRLRKGLAQACSVPAHKRHVPISFICDIENPYQRHGAWMCSYQWFQYGCQQNGKSQNMKRRGSSLEARSNEFEQPKDSLTWILICCSQVGTNNTLKSKTTLRSAYFMNSCALNYTYHLVLFLWQVSLCRQLSGTERLFFSNAICNYSAFLREHLLQALGLLVPLLIPLATEVQFCLIAADGPAPLIKRRLGASSSHQTFKWHGETWKTILY